MTYFCKQLVGQSLNPEVGLLIIKQPREGPKSISYWRIGGGGAPGTCATLGDPNSFIFMQFSAKKLVSIPTVGVCAPLRKILDPPLSPGQRLSGLF